jgi:hypothetical protein
MNTSPMPASLVSWKQYVDQRFSDQDKAVQAALQAAKEAVTKAEIAADKRFDAVNEFRGQLADQTNTFMTRTEYTVQHKSLADQVAALTDRINRTEGKSAGYSQSWAVFVALATIGVGILYIIIRSKP